MNKEQLWKEWEDEFKAWTEKLQSSPVKLIKSENFSEPYEQDLHHIFQLEDGRFALISEQGCSCYEPKYAFIDLFPTLEKVTEAYNKQVKECDHQR